MIRYEILETRSWPKGLDGYNRYRYHVIQWLISDDEELVIYTEDDKGGKSAYRCIHNMLEKRGLLGSIIGTRSHEKVTFRKLPEFDYSDHLFQQYES